MLGWLKGRKPKENYIKLSVKDNNLKVEVKLNDKNEGEAVVGLLVSLMQGAINEDILMAAKAFAQANPEWAGELQQVASYMQNNRMNDFILPLEVFTDV
jgi:hypothetical protein